MTSVNTLHCPEHGDQEGFSVCRHMAARIVEVTAATVFKPAPESSPQIWCTTCRSIATTGDWSHEEIRAASPSLACIECVRAEHRHQQQRRCPPGVWYARYEVRPLPGNEHFDMAGGAFVDCMVHTSDPMLANYVMGTQLKDDLWEIIASEKPIEIAPSDLTSDEARSDFETAQKIGHSFAFRLWRR